MREVTNKEYPPIVNTTFDSVGSKKATFFLVILLKEKKNFAPILICLTNIVY